MRVRNLSHYVFRPVVILAVSLILLPTAYFVRAQTADPSRSISAPALGSVDVDRIISEFTAGETKFLEEFGRYGYTVEFNVQSVKNGKVVDA